MDEEQLIALAVGNWKQIGDILNKKENHSPTYYNAIGWLLDEALGSPFKIVASYLAAKDLNSQFDSETTKDIIWNCWLMELGAIVQLEMLRFAFAGGAVIPMDVLVSMEIGIELSRLRIELGDRVIDKIGKWMLNMESRILDMVEGFENDCENFRMGIK